MKKLPGILSIAMKLRSCCFIFGLFRAIRKTPRKDKRQLEKENEGGLTQSHSKYHISMRCNYWCGLEYLPKQEHKNVQ